MALEMIDKIVAITAGLIVVSALLPTFIDSTGDFDWANVTVAGESKDYSYVPKIIVLGAMIGLLFVGVRLLKNSTK